eukprot:354083-Chlamydomonas_euryale.AAC.1
MYVGSSPNPPRPPSPPFLPAPAALHPFASPRTSTSVSPLFPRPTVKASPPSEGRVSPSSTLPTVLDRPQPNAAASPPPRVTRARAKQHGSGGGSRRASFAAAVAARRAARLRPEAAAVLRAGRPAVGRRHPQAGWRSHRPCLRGDLQRRARRGQADAPQPRA